MVNKYTGAKAFVWFDDGNSEVITGGGTPAVTTVAGTKYFVLERAPAGTPAPENRVPVPAGMIFQSPRTGTQITLQAGDRLYVINEDRFCKASASFELSEGAVDVGDDCHPASQIADGITAFSGSASGLFRYDPITEQMDDVTENILNKFMDVVHDSGSGSYTIHPKDGKQAFVLTLINSTASGGAQFQNWLFAPIVFTSLSMSFGHGDPQSHDISFVLGHGTPIVYRVPASAAA